MAYEMWAWVVDDVDGKEGVCTIRRSLADGGQELICLHHRDKDEAEAMRPMAELQTEWWGRPGLARSSGGGRWWISRS